MRARNIKPAFFVNEALVALPVEVRLLFIGLWCMADRRGVIEDRPLKIKMLLFPADNIDVVLGVDMLQTAGVLRRYSDGQTPLLHIPGFKKHQNPHQNEKPSGYNLPEQHHASTGIAPEQHRTDLADSLLLIPDSLLLIPDSGSLNTGLCPNIMSSSKTDQLESQITEILEHFKTTTGKTRVSVEAESNRKMIRGRLSTDKIHISDLKAIIDLKTQQANRGDFQARYLRVETLFNPTKCQSYLAELDGVQQQPEETKVARNNRLTLEKHLRQGVTQ